MTGWASWQPWLIGGIAAALILWYVYRALFADRARGRPRCLRCAQPFTAEQGLVCTECGWAASTRSDLLRPRRHWGKATLGLLILFFAAIFVRIQAEGGNPLVVIPDRVLAWSLRIDPSSTAGRGPVSREIQRRLIERSGNDIDTSSLVGYSLEAVLSGDSSSPPGSESWFERYGGLAQDLRDVFILPRSEAARRLAMIPPRVRIRVPVNWPDDEPVPADLAIRDLWATGTEAVIELHWADAPEATPLESIGYRNLASMQRRHHFLLPPTGSWPASGVLEVRARTRPMPERTVIQIEAGMSARSLDAGHAPGSFTPSMPTRHPVVHPDDNLRQLAPWPGDEITDRAIAAIFADGLRRWPEAVRPYASRFDIRGLDDPRYQGVLFGLSVEIVERKSDGDERVRRRMRIWTPGGSNPVGDGRSAGWTISEEDVESLARAFDPADDSQWMMRIRGDEGLARRAIAILENGGSAAKADRWWMGMVERPLVTRTVGSDRRPFIRMWFEPDGVKRPESTPDASRN